jgi:hypothetical protein
MKVVQFVEGHNFHVDWHFEFEWKEGKTCPKDSTSCSLKVSGIQS